jgi:hypothetical protein
MARSQIIEVVQTTTGAGVTGATVNVYAARTTTPVTIFADETTGSTITNPQTTTAGSIAGWLPEGEYDLAVSGGSITPYTRRMNVLKGGNPLLLASQVTATELAANAVTTAKILDANVTGAKLAAGAAQGNIAAGTITTAQLVGSIPDSKLSNPNNAVYRTIADANGYLTGGQTTGIYWISDASGGVASLSGVGLTSGIQGDIYFDDADRLVAGLTQKLRVRMQLATNATAIGTVTLTGGLYPLSSVAGTAGLLAPTLSATVTAGTTVAYVTPTASTLYPTSAATGFSTDITIPADGRYVLGVAVTINSLAASSLVGVSLQLQQRSV